MQIILWLLFIPFTISLHSKPKHRFSRTIMISNKYPDIGFQKKIHSFSQLIRYKNIVPTMLLCFTGGFLQTKNANSLWKSKNFMTSSIITLFVMCNSMIINDLFDMPVDKINNPSRPLITGEITKKEAISLFSIITIINELLAKQLPLSLQIYSRLAMITITLYTPIFKKIPLMKNIVCAGLVSFSILFCGKSFPYNNGLLYIAVQNVFAGSIHNEILLDIKDLEGDKKTNINTIPVLFGKKNALKLVISILLCNYIWVAYKMSYSSIPLLITTLPIFHNLYKIQKNDFSKEEINNVVKNTNLPLFVSLLYLCSRV